MRPCFDGTDIHRPGLLLAALVLLSAHEASAATTRCVNPGGTGGCFASIQQAVDAAGQNDTIEVAAGTYAENVQLAFPKRITIHGAGPGATVIVGDGLVPAISLEPRTRLVLSGVRVEGGTWGIGAQEQVVLSVSDCEITGNGIGIAAGQRSRVDVTSCAITGNGPSGSIAFGSGLDSAGTLEVVDSTVSGNVGSNQAIRSNRRLTLVGSTVSDNEGTGIALIRRATIERSTISGNTRGGVFVNFHGQVRISNSTISGNSTATSAGGLGVASGQASLDHVTIADNSAGTFGGGIATFQTGKIRIRSSIIADNTAPTGSDCSSSAVRATGVNVVQDLDSCVIKGATPALISADPLLGPLQDNGGATETHVLLPGSPALGALTVGSACNRPDQRGVPRTVPCDLGAFEAP